MAKGPIIQASDLESTFKALRNRDPLRLQNEEVPYSPDYKTVPKQNFAPTTSVSTGAWGNGMTRTASGNPGIIYGQPQFFSPVHTPINWQIPSKRLEIYQWSRFFYENEPKVASAIDFYSFFPMNDFEHECKDRNVKQYFDKLKKRLNLSKWLRLISHEVHLLGDCFPFVEVSCPSCGGGGRIGDEVCEHEGGTVRRIVILNPDYVEVYTSPINPDPIIALRPDEELINMVQRKTPGYERLTPEVIKLISSGQPIRLDNRSVDHLKYGEGGYTKYGIGMVRRLFPILSYKTKLMVAQWIVAERLIVPIKIVKVGSDERPAGPADIAAVQQQLAQTANDPNLTIVTHHAFELDWQGACHDSDTEVLTKNGWKKYIDVLKDYSEEIATYNKDSRKIEYQVPQAYHEYDYNGEMCLFEGQHLNSMVTPNHRMLISNRKWNQNKNKYEHSDWGDERADQVGENTRFLSCVDWGGEIPEHIPHEHNQLSHLCLEDYLRFVGYFVSEGGIHRGDDGKEYSLTITQSEIHPECLDNISGLMYKISSKTRDSIDKRKDNVCHQFIIDDCELARCIANTYGHWSADKKLPRWILNLPKRELAILLETLMDGDGSTRISANGSVRFRYSTVSKELAGNVQEIVTKLGYRTKLSVEHRGSPNQDMYRVYWTQSNRLGSKEYSSVKERHIKRVRYNGKVWCFTVPNGYFLTRRNGIVSIHGNSGKVLTLSNEFDFINQEVLDGMMINNALLNGEGPNFSNAAVGIEAMIERLETFRREVKNWVEEKIYLPEAIRQGFYEENEETGEIEYIYPTIKWNSMHLRDQQQDKTFALQLYEKGLLSAQTILEIFGYNPDMEIERKRFDAVQMMALGQGLGAAGGGAPGGEMGGGFGGGGPMMPGGELGGGMGGDMGGGLGGGEMGGGMGGGMGGEPPIAPGGGGPALASSTPSLGTGVADPSEFGGKVLKEKTREKLQNKQQKIYREQQKTKAKAESDPFTGGMRDMKGRIVFTAPERELMTHLAQYRQQNLISYPIVPQYEVPYGGTTYLLDFAVPHLKIAIEADGEEFHSSPDKIEHDKGRDMKLAQIGWTVLRFSDSEIEDQIERVLSTIVKTIMEKELVVKNQMGKDKSFHQEVQRNREREK